MQDLAPIANRRTYPGAGARTCTLAPAISPSLSVGLSNKSPSSSALAGVRRLHCRGVVHSGGPPGPCIPTMKSVWPSSPYYENPQGFPALVSTFNPACLSPCFFVL